MLNMHVELSPPIKFIFVCVCVMKCVCVNIKHMIIW